MEQKDTFKKRLLTILVLSGGEMEYSTLQLMDYSRITKANGLKKLAYDEGLIRETYRNDTRAIKLRLFDKQAALYMPSLWEGAMGYAPRNIFDGTKTGIARKHRLAEVLVILSEAGISITPDRYITRTLPPHLQLEPTYTPLIDLRETFGIPKDTFPGARGFGVVTAPSGIFAIYYVGKKRTITWHGANEGVLSDVEKSIYKNIDDRPLLDKLSNSTTNEDKINDFVKNGAILLSGDYRAAVSEILSEYKKYSWNYTYQFHNAYLLPTDTTGIIFLGLMMKAGWRKRLTGLFIKDSERVSDVSRSTYDIDGVVDGVDTLCALDMDILRLARLSGKDMGHGSLNVICFDFQAELIKDLLPDSFNVLSYPFVDVIRAFYDVEE